MEEETKPNQTAWNRLPPEAIERIKEKRLLISDIEKDTKEDFKLLAKTYFNNNYAPTIKYLLDCNKSLNASTQEETIAKIDILAEQIAQLENKINALKEEPQVKPRKINDGSTRMKT